MENIEMRFVKFLAVPLALLFIVAPAFAWPSCSGNWVGVATGTKSTASSGYGAVVVEGGSTWQCQPKPDPTPTPTPSNTNTNTNSNQNSNSNQNNNSNNNTSNSNSNAGASSNSNSNSSATGGTGVGIGTGGSVKNSGNSSNTNNNSASAQGGAGGAGGSSNQTQTANSSSSNNSTGSGNSTNLTNTYTQVRQAPMAYAPDALSTSPCIKGFSGGASAPFGAANLGFSKTDKGCDSRQTAVIFHGLGNDYAAAKVLCSTDASKRAHLTLEECQRIVIQTPAPVIEQAPAPAPAPTIIVVPTPAPTPVAAPAPVPVVEAAPPVPKLIGVCTFASTLQCSLPGSKPGDPTRVTSTCDKMIAAAIKLLEANPTAKLRVVGNVDATERSSNNTIFAVGRSANVKRQLVKAGIDPNRITTEVGTTQSRTVELWLN